MLIANRLLLTDLMQTVADMRRKDSGAKGPLFRFFERESQIARELLNVIRRDLADLQKMCQGEQKQTNHLRSLSSAISKGTWVLPHFVLPFLLNLFCWFTGVIPQHWIRYKVPKRVPLNEWMTDFSKRLAQLDQLSKSTRYDDLQIWIGGLFIPEAFITATRQAVAHIQKSSLEELQLEVTIGFDEKLGSSTGRADGFAVSGMTANFFRMCKNYSLTFCSPFRIKIGRRGMDGRWIGAIVRHAIQTIAVIHSMGQAD